MNRAYSCYVDATPILRAQGFIWANCLSRIQRVSPTSIFVHMPPGRSDFRDWLESEGIRIIEAPRFDPRNVHCNKLQQLATFTDGKFDQIVLMDCDTAWVGEKDLPITGTVAAKVVDLPNPSETVLSAIFSAADLGVPDWVPVSIPSEAGLARSDRNNCNGGLYIFDGRFLERFAPHWLHWAHWCLDNEALFEKYKNYSDQVSFALAMRELGARTDHLDLVWNYPTHLKGKDILPDISPENLHYHRQFTPHMTVLPVGLERVDKVIESLNQHIKKFIGDRLVNSVFWDFRYAIAPDLGSGVGSRGDVLLYKRELLERQLNGLLDVAVVDVGCGDLEVTRNLEVRDYTGLDVSETALRIASEKRPDWKFLPMRESDVVPKGDVVICLDVLIHQDNETAFHGLLERLSEATCCTLIVSGYEEPPALTSEITRYYGPLSRALKSTGRFASITEVGRYRDTTVLRADRHIGQKDTQDQKQRMKVIVGSGWWCDGSAHDWALGSLGTRSPEFFDLWYRQVECCLAPSRVIVTDSASPLKPDLESYELLQWVELDRNYGHANDLRSGKIDTKYCGFTRSVLNGAMYALCCDADVFVYVEQDCLLWGGDFLRHAVGDSRADIFLGQPAKNAKGLGGGIASSMLQQSLIVVKRPALERFVSQLLMAPWTDGEVSPEETMRRLLEPYDLLRIPYGRSRPINFELPHFYAQHLEEDELREFRRRIEPPARETKHGAPYVQGNLQAIADVLDEWQRCGRRLSFWWRDDDAVEETPELRRLLALAEKFDTVVALAVIPNDVDPELPKILQSAPCVEWQHGFRHLWATGEGDTRYDSGEFGAGRSLESMMSDAIAGWQAMDQVFGDAWDHVFVPPFHALTHEFKSVLPSLGYRALSSGLPFLEPIATLAEVSAELDIMDWPNRRFLGNETVIGHLVELLHKKRVGETDDSPIGILTHHLAMDEKAWEFVEALFMLLQRHLSAELVPADRVLNRPDFTLVGAGEVSVTPELANGPGDVTVVITSCGRQDLLERTLESFLRFNTDPIREILVIEDGDGKRNDRLAERFRDHPVRWHETGLRVGPVRAIDAAYELVSTEYVFHCEDDWEFFAPGFIAKSKTLLEGNPSLLQVWLRGLDDTNHHPIIDFPLSFGGVEYRLLRHHHDAGDWGTWHGLSWNPGLRRMNDYLRIGSFQALDPEGNKETWRVECEAGAIYQKLGFHAAVLADRNGEGYVRHIGVGRRVPRDYLPPESTGCA